MVNGSILHHADVSIKSIHDFRKSKDKIKQLTVKGFKDNAVTFPCVRNYIEMNCCFRLRMICHLPDRKTSVSIC